MTFLVCILIYILGSIITWCTSLWCLYQFQEPINGDDVNFSTLMSLLSWIGLFAVLISFVFTKIKSFDGEKVAKKVNKIFDRFYNKGK